VSNPKKAKGTAAETAVVNYLKETWGSVERRALAGSADKGDISGIPNVCIEVKDHKKMVLSGWIKELDEEMKNAEALTGAVIHKKRGTLNVGEWYATMPVEVYVNLLIEAGY
jgi:Holliday junction resolvase